MLITSGGINSYVSDGVELILAYYKADNSYYFIGQHNGEISSNDIHIEVFNTQQEISQRTDELGVVMPDKELWERAGIAKEKALQIQIELSEQNRLDVREIQIRNELSATGLSGTDLETETQNQLDIERPFFFKFRDEQIAEIEITINEIKLEIPGYEYKLEDV